MDASSGRRKVWPPSIACTEEISGRSGQKSALLKMAMFGGMTPGEANEYDERSSRIAKLLRELEMLSASAPEAL